MGLVSFLVLVALIISVYYILTHTGPLSQYVNRAQTVFNGDHNKHGTSYWHEEPSIYEADIDPDSDVSE